MLSLCKHSKNLSTREALSRKRHAIVHPIIFTRDFPVSSEESNHAEEYLVLKMNVVREQNNKFASFFTTFYIQHAQAAARLRCVSEQLVFPTKSLSRKTLAPHNPPASPRVNIDFAFGES